MDYYTKEWKDYIYENWKVALPLKIQITRQELLYDDRYLLNADDYRNLINSEYSNFCSIRKKYNNLCDEFRNKFGKYEIVLLVMIFL